MGMMQAPSQCIFVCILFFHCSPSPFCMQNLSKNAHLKSSPNFIPHFNYVSATIQQNKFSQQNLKFVLDSTSKIKFGWFDLHKKSKNTNITVSYPFSFPSKPNYISLCFLHLQNVFSAEQMMMIKFFKVREG